MKKHSPHGGLSATEKRAEFAKAVKLHETTTQRALQEVLCISYSHFRGIIEGSRKPSRVVAERLCHFVNKPPAEFWGTDEFHEASRPGGGRDKDA